MPNGDPRDGFSYPTLTLMMDVYILVKFVFALAFLLCCRDNSSQCKAITNDHELIILY